MKDRTLLNGKPQEEESAAESTDECAAGSTDGSVCAEVRAALFALRDEKYAAFSAKLIPNIGAEKVIGVRAPALRKYAAAFAGTPEADVFLTCLPHFYQEENSLHAALIAGMKDYGRVIEELNHFLPYVDNWAVCDTMTPKIFRKHLPELLPEIRRWIGSQETYTVRFAIGMLMAFYLDGDFDPAYPAMVAKVKSDEYYVKMMQAWYFATALAKQYETVLPYLEQHRLDDWTHRKTIQKAVESFRITPEQKTYLKTLRNPGRTNPRG